MDTWPQTITDRLGEICGHILHSWLTQMERNSIVTTILTKPAKEMSKPYGYCAHGGEAGVPTSQVMSAVERRLRCEALRRLRGRRSLVSVSSFLFNLHDAGLLLS